MSSLPQGTGDGWPPETAPQPAPGLSGRTAQGLRGDPRGLWRSGQKGLEGQSAYGNLSQQRGEPGTPRCSPTCPWSQAISGCGKDKGRSPGPTWPYKGARQTLAYFSPVHSQLFVLGKVTMTIIMRAESYNPNG